MASKTSNNVERNNVNIGNEYSDKDVNYFTPKSDDNTLLPKGKYIKAIQGYWTSKSDNRVSVSVDLFKIEKQAEIRSLNEELNSTK
jgi:hypothetical protein